MILSVSSGIGGRCPGSPHGGAHTCKKKKYPIIPKSCTCPTLRGKDLKVKETILPALKKRFTPIKQLIKGPMVFYRILVKGYLLSTYYAPGTVLESEDKRRACRILSKELPMSEEMNKQAENK